VSLAGYAAPRRVDSSGKVSVYNWNHSVGKTHQGSVVDVLLDPERCAKANLRVNGG
jgi:hypothetical protein